MFSVAHSKRLYQAAMKQFGLLDTHVSKFQLVHKRCEEEVAHYSTAGTDAVAADTRARIESLGAELTQEQVIRQYKQQYEMLAKQINDMPARASQGDAMASMTRELEQLSQKRASVEAHLAKRRHEFQLLMQTVQDLQRSLEEDPVALGDDDGGSDGEAGEAGEPGEAGEAAHDSRHVQRDGDEAMD